MITSKKQNLYPAYQANLSYLVFLNLFWVIPVLALLTSAVLHCEEITDLACPNQFHIRQDPVLRMFHIFDDRTSLGAVLSSSFGQLDFYDHEMKKQWVNRNDSFFDSSERCIGSIKFRAETEWFWARKNLFRQSTEITIFSSGGELLATFDAEGEGTYFVFRDPENRKPLAIALWNWILAGKSIFSWFDQSIQDWEVIVVDRPRMEEKKIPVIFLVWAILKQAQMHFPDPAIVKYLDKPPTS